MTSEYVKRDEFDSRLDKLESNLTHSLNAGFKNLEKLIDTKFENQRIVIDENKSRISKLEEHSVSLIDESRLSSSVDRTLQRVATTEDDLRKLNDLVNKSNWIYDLGRQLVFAIILGGAVAVFNLV